MIEILRGNKNQKSGQSLIEIVMAIALAGFFMGMTVMSLAFTNTRYVSFIEKKIGFDLLKRQKLINEMNLGRFLAMNKSIDGWSVLGAFPYQGAHQTYTSLNYITDVQTNNSVLNEEKKLFADDKPFAYWSLDAVPTSSTYILDDTANKNLMGTLACYGSPCNNPYIISPSLGRCVHNDCLQFSGDSNGGSAITFASNTTLNAMTKTTWEAWIYPTSVSSDQMFISKEGGNYFRINSSKAFVSFIIGSTQRTLSGNTTLQNNNWYHVVASFDGSKIRIYVNGKQDVTPATYSGNVNFASGLLYFGLWTTTDRRPFIGKMDEVRIYDYALSDTEVANHYKAMREQIGLLGLWHFDDALGVGNYSEGSSIGTSPRFKTFSVPDNLYFSTQLVEAENSSNNCKEGSCLEFNSAYASKATFTDSGNLYPLFHAPKYLTTEMWIKPLSVTGVQGLLTKNSSTNYKLYLNGTSIVFSLKIGGTQYTETYAAGLTINNWYLLDFTYDGTNMSLYIDGVLKQSWTHAGTITDDGSYNNIYLGWTGSGSEYFSGWMDELRMYNRALTSDEINNRYDGGYTYYQYFKPVCKPEEGNLVLDSECLNCIPKNGSECQTTKTHGTLEPLLNRVVDVIKWGKGIKYQKLDIKQVETPIESFDQLATNKWISGVAGGDPCLEYAGIGGRGDSACADRCSCGEPKCCGDFFCLKYVDAKVCSATNMSFYQGRGCSDCGYEDEQHPGVISWCDMCNVGMSAYFRMTDPGLAYSESISQTFALPSKFGLLRFSWSGTLNGGKVKIQFACKDSITGSEPESSWNYMAVDPTNSVRCGDSYYYDMSVAPGEPMAPSSCWETDNQSLYNCKFFRYKIRLEPGPGAVSPVVNDIMIHKANYVR